MEEKPQPKVAEIISAALYRDEEGHLRSRRTHRRVAEHIGKPMSEETKRKLAEARARARVEGKERKQRIKEQIAERSVENLANYRDEAIQGLVRQMRDSDCSEAVRQKAYFGVIEHTDGKPTQKVEIDDVREIRYVTAEHEPVPEAASGE